MAIGTKAWKIRESPFWQAYGRSRYTILFYVLLLTLVAMPVAATLGMPVLLFKLMIGLSLFAAVMPNATRRTRHALLFGAALLVLAQFAPQQGSASVKYAYVLAFIGVVGLAAAAGALGFAVNARTANRESIYAALSTYLLAGLFFGQIYWSIEFLRPQSFAGPDPFTNQNAVYFSFVTLATLGYGDFLPKTPIARGLATFEVIGGQLYLAVLVARLLGTFVNETPETRRPTPPPAGSERRRHPPA